MAMNTVDGNSYLLIGLTTDALILWQVHYVRHLEKCKGAIPHFWAKIAPNRTILAKSHYFARFGQNRFISHFLEKIALLIAYKNSFKSLKT